MSNEIRRERVIVDIETVDQALKVEETVRTGYCNPILENILQWIAVEEDLKDSYERLSEKTSELSLKKIMRTFAEESKENRNLLEHLLKSFEDFSARKVVQIEKLKAVKASSLIG